MKYLIFIVSFWLIIIPLITLAQATTNQSSTPTILPGQRLYFLELFKEKIQIFTAVNPTTRAQLYLDLANQRLAEYEALSKQGKNDLAKKSFDQYLEKIKLSIETLQTLKQQNKPIDTARNDAAAQLKSQAEDLSSASTAINEVLPDKLSRAQQIAEQAHELWQKFVLTAPTSTPSSSKMTWLQWLQKMFDKLWPKNLQLIKR